MLEMSRESFFNYYTALKKAMFMYSQDHDKENNGKKIIFILKEFEINISLDKLTWLNTSTTYQEIADVVDELFFGDTGLAHEVIFF